MISRTRSEAMGPQDFDPQIRDAVTSAISGWRPGPIVLTGRPGAGRRALVASAAFAARSSLEGELLLARCDLEGYEPDAESIAGFLRYRAWRLLGIEVPGTAEPAAAHEPELSWLTPLLEARESWGASRGVAMVLAILLDLSASGHAVEELAAGTLERLAASDPSISGRQLLEGLLRELSQGRRLLLHCVDDRQLSEVTRARVVAMAGDLPGVRWVVSVGSRAAGPSDYAADVIAVSRLPGEGPQAALDAGDPAGNPRREEPLDEQVTELLELAALCGRVFPITPLFELMGLAAGERQRVLEQIDESLVQGADAILEDLEYRHPGFPGELVYAFRDERTVGQIAVRGAQWQLARRAGQLLFSLDERFPAPSLSVALLLDSVAAYTDPAQDAAGGFHRWPGWWADLEETESLAERLAATATDPASVLEVWRAVKRCERCWPAARSVVLTTVCLQHRQQIPEDQLGDLLFVHGNALRAIGQLDAALAFAHEGLELAKLRDELASPRPPFLLGLIQQELGDCKSARRYLEQALANHRNAGVSEDEGLVAMLEVLADVERELGDPGAARLHLQRALQVKQALYGDLHRDLVVTLKNLASLARRDGLLREAKDYLAHIVAIEREAVERLDGEMLTVVKNLATMARRLGETQEAFDAYQMAWAIEQQAGGGSFDLAKHLAGLARELGDVQAAYAYYQAAWEIERRDGRRPLDLAKHLSQLAQQNGEAEQALAYYRQALEIEERQLGEDSVLLVPTLKNLARLAREAEAPEVTQAALQRAARLLTEAARPDSEIQVTLKNLAQIAEQRGDQDVARDSLERLLAMARNQHGEHHPAALAATVRLASSLIGFGELEAAEERLLAALAVWSGEAVETEHYLPEVHLRMLLAQLYAARAEQHRAHGYLSDALRLSEEVAGLKDPLTLAIRERMDALPAA
ncbi:MAG: tetratricopeptide repeat protein [Acidobacteriota bacterium]